MRAADDLIRPIRNEGTGGFTIDPIKNVNPNTYNEQDDSDQSSTKPNVPRLPELDDFCSIVFKDPGYNWLLDQLRSELLLFRPNRSVAEKMRDSLVRALRPENELSIFTSPQEVEVAYSVDWDPRAFLDTQEYKNPNASAILKAITLTGTDIDAQALTCYDYVTQTWPGTGRCTIDFVQKLLQPDIAGSLVCQCHPIRNWLCASNTSENLQTMLYEA